MVPTGNFGNILAAYYAKQMGLPVGKLICASNRNNVLTDFFATGEYSVNRPFHKTTSPSMDILVSSNLERLLFELADRDSATVVHWMADLKEHGLYSIGAEKRNQLCETFAAGFATDEQAANEIRLRFEQDSYLMDTHTAVASHVLRQYRENGSDNTPTVIVSTANPYKFITDVVTAITGAPCDEDAFSAAEKLHELTNFAIPSQVSALKSLPVLHQQRCARTNMAEAVLSAFRKE